MARIRLDNLTKEFSAARRGARPVRALDQVSLDIPDGELLTVLGPSGCGKTTLLRVLAGLEPATSGAIFFDDRVVTTLEPQDRDVAMAFQQDALLPHLTARENIELGLRLRGVSRTEIASRLQSIAGLLDLRPTLERRPDALSGGERQRVALGRALIRQPEVLLLDEPFSSLDAPLRTELRARLGRVHRSLGTTLIHVTHDQNEAMALGHRVAVLRHGALQQVASPAALYGNPGNVFVAGFVGSPPMNLWPGTLVHQGGALWFQAKASADDDRLTVCLIEQHRAALTPSLGKEILLGLRSADIADPREQRALPYGSEVVASVIGLECHGADTLVRWSSAGSEFITRCASAEAPAPETTQAWIFDMSRAYYFESGPGGARVRPP